MRPADVSVCYAQVRAYLLGEAILDKPVSADDALSALLFLVYVASPCDEDLELGGEARKNLTDDAVLVLGGVAKHAASRMPRRPRR